MTWQLFSELALSFTLGWVLRMWTQRRESKPTQPPDDSQEQAEWEEVNAPVPDHGPFRTREKAPEDPKPEPEPKVEVLCRDCVHLRQEFAGKWTEPRHIPGGIDTDRKIVCSLGPMQDKGPILGAVRGVRSCEETNKRRNCPDHKGYSR